MPRSATNSGHWMSHADLLGSVASHLEPRDVIDYLYQEHALSDDDIELITAEVTRKQRCKRLIQQLLLRANTVQVLDIFRESLRFNYDFLTEEVSRQVETYLEQSIVMIHPYAKKTNHTGRSSRKSGWSQPSIVTFQPQLTRGKRVLKVYNDLSSVLNRGEIDTFESHVRYYLSSDVSPDIKCIVMYLNACKELFQNDVTEALRIYKEAMLVVPKTEHPVVFEVEMMSVKAWTYVKHGKLNRLQSVVSSAMQTMSSEPRCSGKIAGWILIDYAHLLVAMLESANPKRGKRLRKRALMCLKTASDHFQADKGNDGPFGFNFALVKYASVLLRCGNNLQFVNAAISKQDLTAAENSLRRVEGSENGLPNILKVFYYLAKIDLYIRKENYSRARDYVEDVLPLSLGLKMKKENRLAQTRHAFIKSTYDTVPSTCCPLSSDSSENIYISCKKPVVCKGGRPCRGLQLIFLLRECVRLMALLTCIGVGMLSPVII